MKITRPDLAEVVDHLYDAALKDTSRKTYGTGQRHYFRFAEEIKFPDALAPFRSTHLSKTELSLSFYIAYLMLRPTITKASTIMGYVSHVKYYFRENGCQVEDYTTAFLKQIRRGLDNTYPRQADKRGCFFLPFYIGVEYFVRENGKSQLLIRLATVLGFIGMLRPHTFEQLQPSSFIFVHKNNSTIRTHDKKSSFKSCTESLPHHDNIAGFYIEFQAKTMNKARAYFPRLSTLPKFQRMCPVNQLLRIAGKGWVKPGFLKKCGKGKTLAGYLQKLASTTETVAPYALRIGGRTWYLSNEMDRQFVDYLGTWKSPEASARYYRERPATVLKRLSNFYGNIRNLD